MACDDYRDDLMEWLYDEAEPPARRRAEAHLQDCAACAEELAAFQRVRRDLTAWSLPARAEAPPAPARPSPAALQGWLPVAAAVLIALAAAFVLSGSEVRAGNGTLTFTFGRAAARSEDGTGLAALEARYEARLVALKSELVSSPNTDAALLEQVRQMLRESEARQAVVLEAGLRDLAERTDEQRRYDIAQMRAGLSYVEGKTGLQVARTTELMGHVLQASQKR